MDLVDKLLANVPKDDLGFEDIDKFWLAAGTFSIHLSIYCFKTLLTPTISFHS